MKLDQKKRNETVLTWSNRKKPQLKKIVLIKKIDPFFTIIFLSRQKKTDWKIHSQSALRDKIQTNFYAYPSHFLLFIK